MKFVNFSMRDANGIPVRCCIPILAVNEVSKNMPMTHFPNIHPGIAGVANLRGGAVAVIDLGHCLGLAKPSRPTYIVLNRNEEIRSSLNKSELTEMERYQLQTFDESIALMVDDHGDTSDEIGPEMIEMPPAHMRGRPTDRFIARVLKTPDGLVSLINVTEICNHIMTSKPSVDMTEAG